MPDAKNSTHDLWSHKVALSAVSLAYRSNNDTLKDVATIPNAKQNSENRTTIKLIALNEKRTDAKHLNCLPLQSKKSRYRCFLNFNLKNGLTAINMLN